MTRWSETFLSGGNETEPSRVTPESRKVVFPLPPFFSALIFSFPAILEEKIGPKESESCWRTDGHLLTIDTFRAAGGTSNTSVTELQYAGDSDPVGHSEEHLQLLLGAFARAFKQPGPAWTLPLLSSATRSFSWLNFDLQARTKIVVSKDSGAAQPQQAPGRPGRIPPEMLSGKSSGSHGKINAPTPAYPTTLPSLAHQHQNNILSGDFGDVKTDVKYFILKLFHLFLSVLWLIFLLGKLADSESNLSGENSMNSSPVCFQLMVVAFYCS